MGSAWLDSIFSGRLSWAPKDHTLVKRTFSALALLIFFFGLVDIVN